MSTKAKLLALILLFALHSLIYFFDGIIGVMKGISYAEYGNAFIQTSIMAYLAYAITYQRNKWIYWATVLFAGLALLRFGMGGGLLLFTGEILAVRVLILGIIYILAFAVIPLLILFQKDIRNIFLKKADEF
jgi:hypothetical protein